MAIGVPMPEVSCEAPGVRLGVRADDDPGKREGSYQGLAEALVGGCFDHAFVLPGLVNLGHDLEGCSSRSVFADVDLPAEAGDDHPEVHAAL